VFGLHVSSGLPVGRIGYRPGAAAASADELRIKSPDGRPCRLSVARGRSYTAAQIVLGVQTIVSRRTDLMNHRRWSASRPINAARASTSCPTCRDTGTIRTYDADVRRACMPTQAGRENIAASANARPTWRSSSSTIRWLNNAKMVRGWRRYSRAPRMETRKPVIKRRRGGLLVLPNEVPGMFFNVGVVPADQTPQGGAEPFAEFFLDGSRWCRRAARSPR